MFRLFSIMNQSLFICMLLIAFGFTQELQFQREIDTIPFYINGVQVHSPFAGGMIFTKPTFTDIDNDGDGDLFVGQENGQITLFRNTGTPAEAKFTFETDKFAGIDVGKFSAPAFADIDHDGDLDLFIGELEGNINFYRNTGSAANPNFMLINETLAGIDVGAHSYPCFADIDADGDFDLFIGEEAGNINLYRNLGTAANANFVLESENYAGIDVGDFSTPTLFDIDKDNDLDLLVGERDGNVNFYRNFGSATNASYQLVTTNFAMIDVGENSSLAFLDADNDGDWDLYAGAKSGETNLYRNIDSNLNLHFVYVSNEFASIYVQYYSAPVFSDIDSDGDLDLFIGASHSSSYGWLCTDLYFFENKNINSFELKTRNFIGEKYDSHTCSPAFVDIENDGDFDLFVGGDDGSISFYKNVGTDSAYSFILETAHFVGIDVGSYSVPTFCDIDDDNDFDLFVGGSDGKIQFYRNTGTPENPYFSYDPTYFSSIVVGTYSAPAFADVDNDGDFDLFIGEYDGNINCYINAGTAAAPIFNFETDNFASIDVGIYSRPTLTDIDNDGNIDLFIGGQNGRISYYSNRGTTLDPVYSLEIQNQNSLDLGGMSIPTFTDIDADQDFDLFLGKADGALSLFRNTGTAKSPSFMLVTDNFSAIDVGNFSAPYFIDLDQDQDFDLLVGAENGRISFQRNTGTMTEPAFTLVTDSLCTIDVGSFSFPTLFDFDHDGRSDLFIGEGDGNLNLFRHTKAPLDSMFTLVTENFASIAVDSFSAPIFADIDNDSLVELLVGEKDGNLSYYRWNPIDTTFTLETEHFFNIDVGQRSAPTLVDIDADGDLDLFIGEQEGGLYFYRNLLDLKPAMFLSTNLIDFGRVSVASVKDTTFTITNSGSADLIIQNLKIKGNPSDFSIISPTRFPITLSPTDSALVVKVRFAPTFPREKVDSVFARQDTLLISCNDPNNKESKIILMGNGTPTAVNLPEFTQLPDEFALSQNYPNPFNPETTIRYQLPRETEVKLEIFDILGKKIISLIDMKQAAGYYSIPWFGKDASGSQVASGIYFYRMQAGEFVKVRKLTLLK